MKCESYKQRLECLGDRGAALDYILRLNGLYAPTPIIMSIQASLDEYERVGGEMGIEEIMIIQEKEFERYHKIVGDDIRSAYSLNEYDQTLHLANDVFDRMESPACELCDLRDKKGECRYPGGQCEGFYYFKKRIG
ncbi:MAG: hypothetical protein PUB73_06090 [Bacteroidales bacterium]|nr:hypothetical protein [Bacteroidales bacterium]